VPAGSEGAEFADFVRSHDRARYQATLFAPARHRAGLIALYALRAELTAIPDLVSEPGLGEIRLKWWSDALMALAAGGAAETPILRALQPMIVDARLPGQPLAAMADAFALDLYADPPPTMNDMEGFFGETQSQVFQLAAGLLVDDPDPPTADVAGHAGVAYGLTHRLAAIAHDHRAGRTIIPADCLRRHVVSADALFSTPATPQWQPVIVELVAHARTHLSAARTNWSKLPRDLRQKTAPAFLPLAIVEPLLRRIERAGAHVVDQPVRLSDLKKLSSITIAALRRRIA